MAGEGQKPKRVAIIGGGPAGLALAIALRKLPTGAETVKVFEKKGELRPGVGGGLQINGGASVLSRLGLESPLEAKSNRVTRLRTRRTDGSQILEVDIPELFKSTAASRNALMRGEDALQFSIMRDALQQTLADNLPPDTLHFQKEVASVAISSSMASTLRFTDGTSEDFDLIVGCDGVKSKIREAIVGPETPFYSGIKILFGIAEHGEGGGMRRPQDRQELHQWFGDGAYAFTATYGGKDGKTFDQIVLVKDDPNPQPENEDYEEADQRAALISGLEEGGMPEDILLMPEQCQRFFDVGVYFHNPLIPWVKGNAVLAGDAAHAMPPFLGQGANQAIQDAYCLAECLAAIGSSHTDLPAALQAYEFKRKPPTTRIMFNSWFVGKLETGKGPGALLRNQVFTVLGRLGVASRVFLDGAVPKV